MEGLACLCGHNRLPLRRLPLVLDRALSIRALGARRLLPLQLNHLSGLGLKCPALGPIGRPCLCWSSNAGGVL